ncbi:MAG: hypothetical protein IKQ31_04195 [Clostridia bacterium]|nr:hypothetical protein [Clostridia bacterium]
MTTEEQFEIFSECCDELKNSKIIIADAKVSKLLRSIVSSPSLVDIVGEALVGYNFDTEFNKCIETSADGTTTISLPSEPHKIIALVFSLLSEFDSHRMDLQEFILSYFKSENLTKSFKLFNTQLIDALRENLSNWIGIGKSEEQKATLDLEQTIETPDTPPIEPTTTEADSPDKLFADLKIIFEQIKETINTDVRVKQETKDDLNITIEALLETLRLKNFKILNALLISLNNMIANIKSTKYYHQEMQTRLAKFYENFI